MAKKEETVLAEADETVADETFYDDPNIDPVEELVEESAPKTGPVFTRGKDGKLVTV